METSGCRLSGFWAIFAQRLCAGDNLIGALRAAHGAVEDKAARVAVEQVIEDILADRMLSEAMAAHPDTFSRAMVCLVEAGERAGILDRTVMFMLEAMRRCPSCGCWA